MESLEPDFLQFKVTAGHASFDLRTLEPGHTVEVDTPNAAFTIDHAGYYRVDVNVENINVYRNAGVRNGMVVVKEDRFGHGPITSARITQVEAQQFRPIHEGPKATSVPASLVPSANRGVRPPEASLGRPVVATRAPHAAPGHDVAREPNQGPAPRLVSPPQSREAATTLPRPAFGQSRFERSTADRAKSPAPPKPEFSARPTRGPEAAPSASRPVQQRQRQEQLAGPSPATPQLPRQRLEAPRETGQRSMPGEPASRLSPGRGEAKSPQVSERKPPTAGRLQQSPEKAPRGRPVE